MPKSCKCILDRMVFKGTMTKDEREKILRNLKGVDWIPVTERLPEKEGEYLVTKIDHRNISVVSPCYYNIEWDWSTGYDVIAWMPLPEPYKEGAGK